VGALHVFDDDIEKCENEGNEDAMGRASRGAITRLADRTVLERTYNGKIYVIFCRKGFYDYKQKRYDSLAEVA